MKKITQIAHILITGLIIFFAYQSYAGGTQFQPDAREHFPAAFRNSYVGFGADYTNIPYANKHLINGFRAQSFTNPSFGLNVYIGHFFNPYLAAQISLMRPIKWAYANGVTQPNSKNSIWISIFGLTLRPTYPITDKLSLYGLAGLGIVSRHGFNINNTTAIPSEDLYTFLTGGGVTYAFTPNWHANLGLEYALARDDEHQPQVLYSYASVYYLMTHAHLPKTYNDHYIFHKNMIQIGGFSTDLWDLNVNKYFTVGYIPIFWSGDVKTKNGAWFMYTRNIYHTHKRFSFDVGTSISTYHSKVNDTSFQAISVFPMFRFWLVRGKTVDFYFMYEVAGPTYLTRRHIDNLDLGGQFSFQDLMGVGFFFGKEKNINLSLKIGHYSNGNLLPNNPGIEVPLSVSLGWAFK